MEYRPFENLENFEISQAILARFRDFEILEMSSLLYTIIIKNGCHDTLSLSYQAGFQLTLGAIPQICHVSVHTVYNNSFGTLLSFLLSWKPQKSTQHPQKWVVRYKNHQNPPSTSKVKPIAVIHMFKVVLYIVGFLISKSRNLAQINLENFEIENGCEISRFRDLAKGLLVLVLY